MEQVSISTVPVFWSKSRRRGLFTATVALGTFLSGCELSQEKGLYAKGERLEREKKYDESLTTFDKIIRGYPNSEYAPRAAERASHEALDGKKDFVAAVHFLREWIQLLKSPQDLKRALGLLAEIQFEKTAKYDDAIETYNQLLDLPHSRVEGFGYKLNLARSNYFTNKFSQALAELNDTDPLADTPDEKFQAQLLRANVLLAQKHQVAATNVLAKLLDDFPDQSRRENVGLTLAVALEERGDLVGAIAVLNRIRSGYPLPDFIERKIDRLNERKQLQPGARGRKK